MKKRLITILFFILVTNINLLVAQVVTSNIPNFDDTISFSSTSETTTVIAEASSQPLILSLQYNSAPLLNNTTISQDSNNEILRLDNSWVLTPFELLIDGSEIIDYNLNVEIELGYFQLLNDSGNIAEGSNGFTVDTQALILGNLTNDPLISFAALPARNNAYKYSMPITTDIYYNQESIIQFQLSWEANNSIQPGSFISIIQISFYTD